ncbi:diguanylate cyclase [Marinobacter vulgaris]|uniref:Diguanylate cyclase n=1 Tax=Marinobacter vulgaris TaxID=1928331 RepID=A0A2V3ZST1_9GAMM|nr:diguanylate cyclase [Marinobacter vulgaris]PXX93306.1 diguanylate cyclase [Marinobacter vulgaris]TSJ72682.1 PhnD/SsuA/transferrin family substrate-binding protein [Marinobacter vulgaris]
MSARQYFFLLVALFITECVTATVASARETLTFGVFAYRPDHIIRERYEPLAQYLSEEAGVDVELEVLDQADMSRAVAANRLDFFLTNPSHFLQIRSERSLTGVLATLVRRSGNHSTSSLGGVIFTAAGRETIQSLEDLPGKSIASPGVHFLGGFQAQTLELLDAGFDVRRSNRVRFVDTHDRVVRSVLAGNADVGFIRTSILEEMAEADPDLFTRVKVLNQQALAGFPYVVSTRLYPEWPLVALPHVNERVVRRVASALFAIEPDDRAAVSAGITGFSPPADYQSVEYLARTLRVPPYDQMPQVAWIDVLNQYRAWAFTIVVLVLLLFGSALWLAKSKRQLAAQQKRLKQLIQDWPQPALLIQNGIFVNTNRAAVDLLKYTSNASLSGKSLEAFSPETQPDGQISQQKMEQRLSRVRGGQVEQCEWVLRRSDQSEVWVDMTLAPVQGEGGAGSVILCSLYDITRRKRAEQRQRLAASVFDHSREAIFITDSHGMVIEANDAYLEITGWPQSRAIGRLPPLPVEEGSGVFASARAQGFWSGEFRCKHLVGEPRVLAVTISSVCGDHGEVSHFVGMFSDISRLKEQEQKLTIMAHYDALTGLPNRVLFSDRLQQAMALTRRQGSKLAVVYIDLDEFKPVNDAFGHEAGDQLLIEVAARMRAVLREEDTLARLGGDEFAAIVTNVQQEASLESLLARLRNQVAEPVWVACHSVEVSASIGYTLFPQTENLDGDQLLRQADQAMYEAKHRGRNRYIRFSAPCA